MKKCIALLAALVLLLTGCGSEAPATEPSTTAITTAPTATESTAGLASAMLELGSAPTFIFYPEVDAEGKTVYAPEAYVFALDGKYKLESEIFTDKIGRIAIAVKTYAFAVDNTVEYIVNGTDIHGEYNIGAYLAYAETTGDEALVSLVERLIKYAESAESYRDSKLAA